MVFRFGTWRTSDLGEEGRDGAYVAVDKWGVALINGSVDPGRRRFNLAHELGHHLFADAYAPGDDLASERDGAVDQRLRGPSVTPAR